MDLRRIFRFRAAGRDHNMGDVNCSGCESVAVKSYPRLHSNYEAACLGLVHAEKLRNATTAVEEMTYRCDVCNESPE